MFAKLKKCVSFDNSNIRFCFYVYVHLSVFSEFTLVMFDYYLKCLWFCWNPLDPTMWNPPVHFFQPIYNGISKFLFPVQNIPERLATRRWMQKRESKNLLKAKKIKWVLKYFLWAQKKQDGLANSFHYRNTERFVITLTTAWVIASPHSWDHPNRYIWISMKQTLI